MPYHTTLRRDSDVAQHVHLWRFICRPHKPFFVVRLAVNMQRYTTHCVYMEAARGRTHQYV